MTTPFPLWSSCARCAGVGAAIGGVVASRACFFAFALVLYQMSAVAMVHPWVSPLALPSVTACAPAFHTSKPIPFHWVPSRPPSLVARLLFSSLLASCHACCSAAAAVCVPRIACAMAFSTPCTFAVCSPPAAGSCPYFVTSSPSRLSLLPSDVGTNCSFCRYMCMDHGALTLTDRQTFKSRTPWHPPPLLLLVHFYD